MATEHLLVRGVDCFSSSLKVPFMQAVPESLRCRLCRNVSAQMRMDTDDHTYCQDCINMMDEDGKFMCVVDNAIEYVETLRNCTDPWKKVLGLSVKCPKTNCKYQATLQDLLVHYPNCLSGGVDCPLCKTCVSAKDLAYHTMKECPQRLLPCPYCDQEHKECKLEEHMQECDQRPAACEHCFVEFNTYAEVRDQHYAVCKMKPIGCPYTCFGCKFTGIRDKVNAHVREDQHIDILVKNFESLRRELKEAKDEIKSLKESNVNLGLSLSEELQHRLNLEDNVTTCANEIKALNQTVDSALKTVTEETQREVKELSRRMDVFAIPMEELLKHIAGQQP